MFKRTLSSIAMLTMVAGLLPIAPHMATAAPPVFPNNPVPPSFYNFNPGYYGPYYPGQYRYGNTNPGIYNNYAYPGYSGYGTSSSVPVPYSLQSYGSSSSFGSTPPLYVPPVATYGYGIPMINPPTSSTSAPARDDRTVLAYVRLPAATAELWVEGRKTTSTGMWRRFSSPPLVAGERYVYEFRARWFDNGHEVQQSRKVVVQAGERIIVDFTSLPLGDAESIPPQTPAPSPS